MKNNSTNITGCRVVLIPFNPRLVIAVLLLSLTAHRISLAQPAKAWESIFNGKNLDGWSIVEKPVNVKVQDSSMVMHMTPSTSRHAYVRTNRSYKDFIFEFELKRDRTIDSGILFRGTNTADTAFNALHGYTMKVDPQTTRLWTGGIFLDFGNGNTWLYTLENDDRARHAEKPDEWNRVRIEAIGQEIKIWVNDIPVLHMIDDRYKEGYIAFKSHFLNRDFDKQKLEIRFRGMRIITKDVNKYARAIDLPAKNTKNKTEIIYYR